MLDLAQTSAATASLLLNLEGLATMGIVWVVFRENVDRRFGPWLHLAERHDHEHFHEVMAHEHRHRHDAHNVHEHSPDDPPGEPHSHWHRHAPLVHQHPHYPHLHHRHGHRQA
jgi:hypothetical protein